MVRADVKSYSKTSQLIFRSRARGLEDLVRFAKLGHLFCNRLIAAGIRNVRSRISGECLLIVEFHPREATRQTLAVSLPSGERALAALSSEAAAAPGVEAPENPGSR